MDESTVSSATRRLLAQALRIRPGVYTWEQLKSNLRKVAKTVAIADAALRQIRAVCPGRANLDRLCELAGVSRQDVAVMEHVGGSFCAPGVTPKLVLVEESQPLPRSQVTLISPEEYAIWRSISHLLRLARTYYRWPMDKGAMYDWCAEIARAFTPVETSPLLQRMKRKGILSVRESGKVGSSQTLWTANLVVGLRVCGEKLVPERLTDEQLNLIVRRGLCRHRADLQRWQPWNRGRRVIIPDSPDLS